MTEKVRICYFVPGPLSAAPPGPAELERRAAYLTRRAFPGTDVEVRETAHGPASIESTAEEHLAVPGLLEALPDLAAEGFDAVVIGCFGDPGLEAARELVEIPVVGPAQAGLHLAAQLGDGVGILTVVEGVVPALRRLARSYGLGGIVTDVRAVEVPVLELRSRRAEVLERLSSSGRASLETGADALVLGCMTMGFLDVAAELSERLGVPVVNPATAALKAAETAVALGLAPSRRAYPTPRKAPEAIPAT